jgi:hypothetical protein
MEATDVEANPEETEAAVERQELYEKEINFDNIGSLEGRYGDGRLVVQRRRWTKKWIQDSARSQQKLSIARKRQIRRTIPAVCKGRVRKGLRKVKAARRAPNGRMLEEPRRGTERSGGNKYRSAGSQVKAARRAPNVRALVEPQRGPERRGGEKYRSARI